jgi:hypothetical protein
VGSFFVSGNRGRPAGATPGGTDAHAIKVANGGIDIAANQWAK